MTQQNLTRRSVAKGAAWSIPVVAVAPAAPALAASPPTPCAPIDCGTPLVSALQITADVTGPTTADVRFAGAITAVLTPCLGLFSVGLVTLRSASLTWKSERTPRGARSGIPATTTTVTQDLSISLGVNAAGVVALPIVDVRFRNLTNLQNGLYGGAVELGSLPSRPTKLCFTPVSYTHLTLPTNREV